MTTSVVGVASYGRGAASARVRLYHWLDRVQPEAQVIGYIGSSNNGIATLLRRLDRVLAAEHRLRQLERELVANVVTTLIISRRASPFGRGGIEGQLLSAAGHSVYDFDDALMSQPRSKLANPKLKWATSIRSAHVVIAGNSFLAEQANALNRNVVSIPSCIEPAHYPSKSDYAIGSPPVAVWLGTPTTEFYLRHIENALLRAHKETGLRLRVVSAGSGALGRLDAIVDRVDWRTDTFGSQLCTADFGIMPLLNDVWSRGKCAYKLLQYGAAGLPVVGDPVGASAEVLDVAGGMAPRDSSEWADILIELVRAAPAKRATMGHAARVKVAERYSYGAWEHLWRKVVGISK